MLCLSWQFRPRALKSRRTKILTELYGARYHTGRTLLNNKKRGNFMKKVMLIFMTLFFVISNNVLANSNVKIDELDMNIPMPSDYAVLTRGIEDNSEGLKALKINKNEFNLMMTANEAYLIALDPNGRYEVNVVNEKSNDKLAKTIHDLNLFENWQIEKKMPELLEALRKAGKNPINNYIYTINKAKYIVYDYRRKDEKGKIVYTRNYNTVKNGKMITISFTRLDGKELTNEDADSFKSIVDKIFFDEKTTVRAKASTGRILLILGFTLSALISAFIFIVKKLK